MELQEVGPEDTQKRPTRACNSSWPKFYKFATACTNDMWVHHIFGITTDCVEGVRRKGVFMDRLQKILKGQHAPYVKDVEVTWIPYRLESDKNSTAEVHFGISSYGKDYNKPEAVRDTFFKHRYYTILYYTILYYTLLYHIPCTMAYTMPYYTIHSIRTITYTHIHI